MNNSDSFWMIFTFCVDDYEKKMQSYKIAHTPLLGKNWHQV